MALGALVDDELLRVYLYEQVCQYRRPFHGLYPELSYDALNTPKFEGLEEALRETFEVLVRSHRLILVDFHNTPLPAAATSSLRDLRVEPFEFVGFSELGAAEWEAAASPRWDEFYNESSDERTMAVASVQRSTVLKLMRNRFGWRVEPVEGTVRWRELRPWQATYWKTLESAWEAEFHYESCVPGHPGLTDTEEQRIAIEEWRRMTKWFTHAWDLPGWKWRIRR